MSRKYSLHAVTAVLCCAATSCIAAVLCYLLPCNMHIYVCLAAFLLPAAVLLCISAFTSNKNTHNSNGKKNSPENDIVSVIAHEIRSPLTSIKGYLCAINDGVIQPENQAQYIGIALDESERAINLLENLMKLTKFDSGSIKLNPERFDINELIRVTLIEKLNDFEQKNISVQTDFAEEQIFVNADRSMIKQVIVNLTDNAVKYGVNGGTVKFTVSVHNNKALISAEDNGIGIEKDALPHIWERFYQADSSCDTTYKGHGLGLCIVKEIIAAHGETITAQSTVESGTVFSFTLKLDTGTQQ